MFYSILFKVNLTKIYIYTGPKDTFIWHMMILEHGVVGTNMVQNMKTKKYPFLISQFEQVLKCLKL